MNLSSGTLHPEHGAEAVYDLVVANISSAVVCELLPAAARALRPGGRIVLSGFMEDRAPDVVAAARGAGLVEPAVEQDGEWCALVARKPVP